LRFSTACVLNRFNVPEVIVSGNTDPLMAEAARALGVVDYVMKPFALERLPQAVQMVLATPSEAMGRLNMMVVLAAAGAPELPPAVCRTIPRPRLGRFEYRDSERLEMRRRRRLVRGTR
jgi:DNA-binding NarL/FixJ family response regulator